MLLRFFLFICLCFSIFADEPIILTEKTNEVSIAKGTFYFFDLEKTHTIDTITKETRFHINNKESLNFGYSSNPLWLKIIIRNTNQIQTSWLLELAFPPLDLVEMYILEKNTYTKKVNGDTLPFKNRDFYFHHLLYLLNLPQNEDTILYLKIQTTSSLYIPLTLHPTDKFLENVTSKEILHLVIFGAMLVMIFYNLFIYFAIRSLRYLLYSLGTFGSLLYYITITGYGFQFLWPNQLLLQKYAVVFSVSWGGIFVTEFTIRFLEIKKKIPFLFYVFRISQFIILSIFSFAFVDSRISNPLLSGFATINAMFFLIAGLISWYRGYRAARLFIAAWAMFFIGISINSLRNLGLIEIGLSSLYIMEFGTITELLLLSLALADQYKLIVEDSYKIQKEIINIQIKHSDALESNVRDRTTELNRTLNSIRYDLSTAKKIQENTLKINHQLIEELEIVPVYIAMEEVGGDFYAVDKTSDYTYRIFLADATGHGVQGALITMAIKGLFDNLKQIKGSPSDFLELFNNEFISRYKSLNTFCTSLLLDIDTKNKRISYASAGHCPCLLFQKKELILLEKTGKIIGITKDHSYQTLEYDFNLEDRIFLFTDGCVEEFNSLEEEFGEERLYKSLTETRHLPLKESIEQVISKINQFVGDSQIQDDITILGIEYKK